MSIPWNIEHTAKCFSNAGNKSLMQNYRDRLLYTFSHQNFYKELMTTSFHPSSTYAFCPSLGNYNEHWCFCTGIYVHVVCLGLLSHITSYILSTTVISSYSCSCLRILESPYLFHLVTLLFPSMAWALQRMSHVKGLYWISGDPI